MNILETVPVTKNISYRPVSVSCYKRYHRIILFQLKSIIHINNIKGNKNLHLLPFFTITCRITKYRSKLIIHQSLHRILPYFDFTNMEKNQVVYSAMPQQDNVYTLQIMFSKK